MKQEAKIPPKKLMCFVLEIVSVLKYLHHDKQLIHKDLNPSNIMLTYDLSTKVTDFGLSHEVSSAVAKDKTFEGTLAYSSPEMVENTVLNEKADIWSLGCVVYELMSFSPCFSSGNPLSLAKAITTGDYKKLKPDSPQNAKLCILVENSIQVDPSKRSSILEVCRVEKAHHVFVRGIR